MQSNIRTIQIHSWRCTVHIEMGRDHTTQNTVQRKHNSPLHSTRIEFNRSHQPHFRSSSSSLFRSPYNSCISHSGFLVRYHDSDFNPRSPSRSISISISDLHCYLLSASPVSVSIPIFIPIFQFRSRFWF